MNDLQKTLVFLAGAVVAVIIGIEPWQRVPTSKPIDEVGKPLYPEFTDPLVAASMDIVQYDESVSTARNLRIAQVDNKWSIPSHADYPADASKHLAEAATSVIDVKALSVAADAANAAQQETYGVVDPTSAGPGARGVGMRVTFKDGKDKLLADLVIGKAVKDTTDQRYVRRANQDRIYTAKLSTDKFSTKFEDWIEKDLLKLNTFDVRTLKLNDYTTELALSQDGIVPVRDDRMAALLKYEDDKGNWKLVELTKFQKETPVVDTLAEDEELNTEKLNALKTALGDLKIIDVRRKPQGMSANLRASEAFVKDRATLNSLAQKGFYPVAVGDSNPPDVEIYSSDGEVICALKDGVEYVLRFGRKAISEGSGGEGGDKAAADGKAATGGEKSADGQADDSSLQLSRYLFVMARLNAEMIPPPQLEPLPSTSAPPTDAAEPSAASNTTPNDGPPGAAPVSSEQAGRQQSAAASSDDGPSADRPEAAAADKPASGDTPSGKSNSGDTPGSQQPQSAAGKPGAASDGKPSDKPAQADDAARSKVEQENKRKQDEYDGKLKKAEERVKELNDRFADWYYIISDDVYKKIHLGRDELIRVKKKKEGEGDSVQDFNSLKKNLSQPGADAGLDAPLGN